MAKDPIDVIVPKSPALQDFTPDMNVNTHQMIYVYLTQVLVLVFHFVSMVVIANINIYPMIMKHQGESVNSCKCGLLCVCFCSLISNFSFFIILDMMDVIVRRALKVIIVNIL